MATLTVLGASSPGTRRLLEELGRAVDQGRLARPALRLWARDPERLRAACEGAPGEALRTTDPKRALDGAEIVIVQVRPGGQAGRAADEALAVAEGVPGDEGIGPSGLSAFLRGRPAMDRLFEAIARAAPGAWVLVLTSPLGLWVGRASGVFGLRALGVCELPAVTSARVRGLLEPALGPLTHDTLGLNHQGWLYGWRDAQGRRRDEEVLALLPAGAIPGVDLERIRADGAIPLPYLRLYHHPERELARQRAAGPRGEQLQRWQAAVEAERDPARRARLLAERAMSWYREGLLPVLEALEHGGHVHLTLSTTLMLPGLPAGAVIELPCDLDPRGPRPRAVGPLPPGPDRLFRRLLAWERAVLALPALPTRAALAELLSLHPLVPAAATAERLAARILAARELSPG